MTTESSTANDVSVEGLLNSAGTALSNLRQALRNTKQDQVATLISHSLDGVKQLIDAAVDKLPPEQPPQTVYDASDYDSTQPETALSGAPASRREWVIADNNYMHTTAAA
eukprot:20411-Heterococcus_DN1.PRE.2